MGRMNYWPGSPDSPSLAQTRPLRKRRPKSRTQTSTQGIDKEAITNPIHQKLEQARVRIEQGEGMSCYIYRVPWCLERRGVDDDLRPRLVSIGPYHYGDPRLEAMQFHKYRVLDCVLKRTGIDISEFLDVLQSLEHEARAAYQDLPYTSFPTELFLEMLLLDGCFVLDYLVGRYKERSHTKLGYHAEDPIFSNLHMHLGIEGDMILLENQIPLIILNHLYYMLQSEYEDHKVIELMLAAFNPSWALGRPVPSSEGHKAYVISSLLTRNNMLTSLEIFWENLMYDNTIDLNYIEVTLRAKRVETAVLDPEYHVIPCAAVLKEAGVVLKRTTKLPFWHVEFKKGGVLEIPQMVIYKGTKSVFLNLMAFELHHIQVQHCKITAYILFLDSLVNSASDVAILRACGIIVSAGQSDREVANLINCLGRRVYIPANQFGDLSQQINEFCNKRRNRWRASLMHNYFNNPWAIISVIAAALLMLLTILQTSYTLAQYYQKQ